MSAYACMSIYEQARLAAIQRELYRINSHDGPFCEREVTAHRHRGHTITVYTYRLRPRFVMHWTDSAKVPASRSVIANYLRWARRAPGFRVMRDGLHKYRVLGYSSDAIHFEALP